MRGHTRHAFVVSLAAIALVGTAVGISEVRADPKDSLPGDVFLREEILESKDPVNHNEVAYRTVKFTLLYHPTLFCDPMTYTSATVTPSGAGVDHSVVDSSTGSITIRSEAKTKTDQRLPIWEKREYSFTFLLEGVTCYIGRPFNHPKNTSFEGNLEVKSGKFFFNFKHTDDPNQRVPDNADPGKGPGQIPPGWRLPSGPPPQLRRQP